jgi:hypothetical protein
MTLASNQRVSTPAVDDSRVYWSEGGSLMWRSNADGSIDTVVQDPSSDTFMSDLLAFRGRLYYSVLRNVGEGSFGLWSVDGTPKAQPMQLPIEAQTLVQRRWCCSRIVSTGCNVATS